MRTLPGMSHKFQPHEVRVVGSDGNQKGVIPLKEAFFLADSEGLDLVCVAPKSVPPVCKIMDFGKFKYEKKKAEKESRKNQKTVQVKEIKLSPKIGEHDLEIKIRHIREFLEEGHKVKLLMVFKGRENMHKDIGAQVINFVLESIADVSKLDGPIATEGRTFVANVTPAKGK